MNEVFDKNYLPKLDLREKLIVLGRDAERIRSFLHQKNIKGKIKSGDCCPIANYLKSEGYVEPNCSDMRIIVSLQKERFYIYSPLEVSLFIHKFDLGQYPELVEQ